MELWNRKHPGKKHLADLFSIANTLMRAKRGVPARAGCALGQVRYLHQIPSTWRRPENTIAPGSDWPKRGNPSMEQWTIYYRETTDPDPHRIVATIPDFSKEQALERAFEMMKPQYKASVLRIVGPKGVEIPRTAIEAHCQKMVRATEPEIFGPIERQKA